MAASGRPSTRAAAVASSSATVAGASCLGCNYTIMGDTLASIIYADRLQRNGITGSIYILTQGTSLLNIPGVQNLDFALTANPYIKSYGIPATITLLPSPDGATGPIPIKQSYTYYYGQGPGGDFVTAYIIPRNGPWYTGVNTRLNRFLACATLISCLNSVEEKIVAGLSSSGTGGWGIPIVDTSVVSRPSILGIHMTFVYNLGSTLRREVGVELFNQFTGTTVQGVSNISFSAAGATGASGYYDLDLTYSGGSTSISNTRVVWETNPYQYLWALGTSSGSSTGANLYPVINLPTLYRAVVTVPETTSKVDLTTVTAGPDLVTTYTAFSLYDLRGSAGTSSFAWYGQAYTAKEDLSINDASGTYAADGYTLLIVECLSLSNRRAAMWDPLTSSIQINANSSASEAYWELSFAQIVSDIYYQYTGDLVDPAILIENAAVCTSGLCSTSNTIDLYAGRESPMVAVLSTVGNLYGSSVFPTLTTP